MTITAYWKGPKITANEKAKQIIMNGLNSVLGHNDGHNDWENRMDGECENLTPEDIDKINALISKKLKTIDRVLGLRDPKFLERIKD